MADDCRLLITGGGGQLGQALLAAPWPMGVSLHAPPRAALDLADEASIRRAFAQTAYAGVINAGAYTAVDRAETDVAAAFRVNAQGPAVLAELTCAAGVPLIQLSTDYVFDGLKNRPYLEDDAAFPLNAYGSSKLAGELAVRCGNPRSVVVRTSWIISGYGDNFLKKMLRMAAHDAVLRVVDDQYGSPTGASDLAAAVQTIMMCLIFDPDAPVGTYHFANAGEASWAGLASHIFGFSRSRAGPTATVLPVSAAAYPTTARRPAYSRLSTDKIMADYGITARSWMQAVEDIMAGMTGEAAGR